MKDVWPYLSVTILMLTGILLIFIILLQRGRGGGLAGAFGGAGGQSALGTKAGDVFTRITIGLAVIWVLLACVSIYALRAGASGDLNLGDGNESVIAPPEALDGGEAGSTPSSTGENADDLGSTAADPDTPTTNAEPASGAAENAEQPVFPSGDPR